MITSRRVSFADGPFNSDCSIHVDIEAEFPTTQSSHVEEISEPRYRRGSILSIASSVFRRRQSFISDSKIARHQFEATLKEPISSQHARFLRKQLGRDIRSKTLTLDEFYKLLQLTPFLGERLLVICGQQHGITTRQIPGESVLRIVHLLWMSSRPVKAYIFFKFICTNDRNVITIDEIRQFYKMYLAELKFQHDPDKRERITDIFLRGLKIDESPNQELTFEQFYNILQEHPQTLESLYFISIPNQDTLDEEENSLLYRRSMYLKNNLDRFMFLLAYISINFALIIYVIIFRVEHEQNHNGWQVTARISGALINIHFVLVVILMLRETMAILRRYRWLRRFIPVDDHIDAHRIIGGMLFLWAVVHTLCHLINYAIHTMEHTWVKSVFTTEAGQGWIHHLAPLIGVILFILLFIMVTCSLQCTRQRVGCFQLFHYTHQIFWLLLILLIIHARDFWKWVIGPMSLFLVEKFYNWLMCCFSYGKTFLLEVIVEENVLVLIIKRPKHFDYKTGDYVKISLSAIAFNEWHPFTLTSTPLDSDKLRIHMLIKKNWTRKVHEHFRTMLVQLQPNNGSLEVVVGSTEQNPRGYSTAEKTIVFNDNQPSPVIRIRGPYSSSTSYMFDDCHHAIVIGGGIGITPYISVLETLIHRIESAQENCLVCGHDNQRDAKFNQKKLKKIDFIWISRDLKNFGCFLKLFKDFEAKQEQYLAEDNRRSRYLDIHLYFTALPNREEGIMTTVFFDIIANVYTNVVGEDIHTALKTVETKAGRPPWRLLFSQFKADQQAGQNIKVFFTGVATMGADIKRLCDEHGFQFSHEPYF